MRDYKALVAKLRDETPCYPDDCEYCSAEGKCRCQRIGEACDAIEELIRPDGKWEPVMGRKGQVWDEVYSPVFKCSECGYELVDYGEKNYCPNCGARMTTP